MHTIYLFIRRTHGGYQDRLSDCTQGRIFQTRLNKKSVKHLPSLPGIPRAKNTASASRNLRKLRCIKNLPASLPLNFLGSPAKAVRPVGPWGKRNKGNIFPHSCHRFSINGKMHQKVTSNRKNTNHSIIRNAAQ